MTTPYKLAFTPGRIGNLELKHRLINSPSIPNFSKRNGQITQREIDYYEEKAKGGYALVFVSATSVNDTTARSFTNQLGIQEDAFLAGWRQLSEAIHRHGAKCGAQIFHPGSQNHPKYCRPGSVPEAPSNVPCDMEAAIPGYQLNEMSKERIREVVNEFAEAARRVKDAGFDLVEIHGAHGYLPMQFFSPQTNKRTDEYGGNFAGRTRFISEVMQATRERVGTSYTVGIRISVDELVEGGVTLEETRGYARFLEQIGFAYISVSLGLYTPLGL
jgi:2,4-dienoyl-CoA reductase-like NADH-dependent reductase (Old Yellow Enzyme family)